MYTIVSKKQIEDSIVTIVKFEGKEEEVEISHFRPTSIEDIDNGIKNRMASEQSKIDAVKVCSELIEKI